MSTIKVNKIENTNTADGGVAIDSSGHVQVDGVQMPTAGALSNRNLVVNGGMQVAQRGTSSTTSGFGTVDRFQNVYVGGTKTQSQGSLTSGSPFDEGFRNYLRVTNTTAGSAAASEYNLIITRIEAQDVANSGWNYPSASSYITLSFWVRASVSQEYLGYFRAYDGTSRNYPFSLGTLTADTWTKVTKTVPGNSGLTINDDNGTGLELTIAPFLGTNFTASGTSLNAWRTYAPDSERLPDMTSTWATTASSTFDLTGVQLEVGEKATPFEHRSFGDELARCQRYYVKHSATSTALYARLLPIGHMTSSSVLRFHPKLNPPMRAVPTYNQSGTFSTAPSVGTPALSLETESSTVDRLSLADSTGISGTGGNAVVMYVNNDADAFVEFSAEL